MQSEPNYEFVLSWNAGKVFRLLLCIIIPLIVLGTLANYVIFHVAEHPDDDLATVARRLDLGNEPSIPNWYSSIALLACSFLLTIIARVKHITGARGAFHWTSLAVLFLLLAIDEAVLIHEMVDGLMQRLFDLHGAFYFGWVIPAMLFVLCLALIYGGFLWSLPRKTRRLFLLAAMLFVGGAIGMEMVAGIIIESRGVESIGHTWSQAVEEFLEMLGVAVFVYALIDYLSSLQVSIRWQPVGVARIPET